MPDVSARRELAEFLRRRRAYVDPASHGLPAGRRRVPGLRREEVALLAGVSVSWYTYLEQARPIRVSTQVIDSIARVLELTPEQHRYIELLATGKAGHRVLGAAPDVVQSVDEVVRAVRGVPVYAADRRGDLFAWNAEATDWFTDFGKLPASRRNMMLWMLTDPIARERFVDWEVDIRDLLGRFRTATAGAPEDARTAEVITQMLSTSSLARQWWDEQEARPMTPRIRRLRHPVLGVCYMRIAVAFLAGSEDLALVFHVPTAVHELSTRS